jgi:hypothetical protein
MALVEVVLTAVEALGGIHGFAALDHHRALVELLEIGKGVEVPGVRTFPLLCREVPHWLFAQLPQLRDAIYRRI